MSGKVAQRSFPGSIPFLGQFDFDGHQVGRFAGLAFAGFDDEIHLDAGGGTVISKGTVLAAELVENAQLVEDQCFQSGAQPDAFGGIAQQPGGRPGHAGIEPVELGVSGLAHLGAWPPRGQKVPDQSVGEDREVGFHGGARNGGFAGDVMAVDHLAVELARDTKKTNEWRHLTDESFLADFLLEVGVHIGGQNVRGIVGGQGHERQRAPFEGWGEVEAIAQFRRAEALHAERERPAGEQIRAASA